MSNKKKNKKKNVQHKKKKKKSPVQKNRIQTSTGINVTSTKKNKKKDKIILKNLIDDIKTKNKEKIKKDLKELSSTISKNVEVFSKKAFVNAKEISKKSATNIKKAMVIIYNWLKKVCQILYKRGKTLLKASSKKGKIFLDNTGIKVRILILNLCKVLLICVKNIKNFVIKQYNNVKEHILYRNVTSKIKHEHKKVKKTQNKEIKKQNRYKEINLADDDPNLLRYRYYKGFALISVFFINRIKVIKFDMKKFKKKFKYGTLKDKILILLMLMLITGFSLVITFCIYIVATAPEISNERLYKSSSSVFLDVNGNEFARRGTENREKVTYDDLPEVLVDAVVSAEDSRFFQHNGMDVARFTKAVIGQLLGRNDAGGGSTITMQVSKNAATSSTSSGFAGIKRKFQDIYLSVFVFEKNYTKDQIMEFYVNIPYLGSGTYGVQQASKVYFGKEAKDLTLVEAATIAGLFQSPDAYDPHQHPKAAENRRNTILNLMCRHGYITESERDNAKAIPLSSTLTKTDSTFNKYQDFIDTVTIEIEERTGYSKSKGTGYTPVYDSMIIHTTMDPAKQDIVNTVMNNESYDPKTKEGYKFPNDVVQTGISVVDVKDGSITAIGASRDTKQLAYNYATRPRRHPGSVAKPVIDYGPAIEYLNWGSGNTVIDDKMGYSGGGQIKNWDNKYKYIMTAKTALAQSRNIPALYTFQQTSNEQKLTFANNLGWHPEDKTGYINESAAIGGFEGVSSLQAAAAYATFARGGTYIEPYSYTSIELVETGEVIQNKPKKVQAMSDATAYIITMILKYAVTSGSVTAGSVSGTDIAAKTGTSTVDSAAKKAAGIKAALIGDSWTVAYSPDYAIATWYGYSPQIDTISDPNHTYYLTGTEGGSARKKITSYLTKRILPKNSKFERPSSVAQVEIELGTDPIKLASAYTPQNLRSVEYFKKGYEPNEVSDRFDKLSPPKNLKYTSSSSSVTLSWDAASTPREANHEALRDYFNSNVYKRWADKYLTERINYNNATFGSFGYQVYMVNQSGTVDLGFTTNTSFTVNTPIDSNTSFVVKSSYQYFKSNQSDGISVKPAANTTTNNNGGNNAQTSFSIQFNHSCVTADMYNNLGPSLNDKIRVISNGQNVTSKANISATCYDATSTNKVDCNNLVNGNEYSIDILVVYGGTKRSKTIKISKNC